MENKDPCSKLSLWTQYTGTCWFNAILTILFHSQSNRNMFLKFFDTLDDNNKSTLQKLGEHIVKHKYLRSDNIIEDRKFYYKVKPERLLMYLTRNYPVYFRDYTVNQGDHPPIIFNKMYKLLGLKCLMLSKNNNIIDYSSYNHYKITNPKSKSVDFIHISDDKIIEILEHTHNNPDVILLNVESGEANQSTKKHLLHRYKDYFNDKIKKLKEIAAKKNVDSENDNILIENIKNIIKKQNLIINNINELNSLKDNIVYNENNYVLDAALLCNYNRDVGGHGIAGITCNNNRYIYNGWNSYTTDPGLKIDPNLQEKISDALIQSPCNIVKSNWNVKQTSSDDSSFCININTCKFPKIVAENLGRDLCFNFGKGYRTLVYIKQELSEGELDFKTKKFKNFNVPKDYYDIYNKPVTKK
jgi:hypothetical protein